MEPNDVNSAEAGPDLRQYLTVVRTYWRGIAAILLATVLLAFVWTLTQPKIYESKSLGMVSASGAEDISNALAGDTLAKSKAASYKSLATSRIVAENVKESLGLEASADQLLAQISVEVPTSTPEIQVSAQSTDPAAAQTLADAWVKALAEQVEQMESDTGEAPVAVKPLGKAALPTVPVSPNTKLALALGAVVGLALGLGYALVRNHLDRRIRSAESVERLGTSVVGTIPVDARLADGRTVVETGALDHGDRESHAFSEALRELRTNLSYMDVDNPPRIIVVTSSVPGEGKSSVAANLAVTIAATGRETVLVDGDLRRPVQTDVFGMPAGAGLTDVLSGHADIEDVLQPYGPVPALSVLAAGRIPPNPSELLGSRAMKSLLRELAETAVVIIDAPPLLPVTDAAVLAKVADGALVTIKAGSTTIDELEKSLENLGKVDAHVLGAILNQVPTKGAGANQYGYYGKYYYSSDTPAADGKSRRMPDVIPVEAPEHQGLPASSEPQQQAPRAEQRAHEPRAYDQRAYEQRIPEQRPETRAVPAVRTVPAPQPAAAHFASHEREEPVFDYDELEHAAGQPSFEDVLSSRAQMRHLRRGQ